MNRKALNMDNALKTKLTIYSIYKLFKKNKKHWLFIYRLC